MWLEIIHCKYSWCLFWLQQILCFSPSSQYPFGRDSSVSVRLRPAFIQIILRHHGIESGICSECSVLLRTYFHSWGLTATFQMSCASWQPSVIAVQEEAGCCAKQHRIIHLPVFLKIGRSLHWHWRMFVQMAAYMNTPGVYKKVLCSVALNKKTSTY